MATKFRVRFAPSASGFLHVGNLRTLLANRDLADALNGELVVRIDDGILTPIEQQDRYARLIEQILPLLGIPYDALFRWSDYAANALIEMGQNVNGADLRNIVRALPHPILQEVINTAIDQVTGVTHTVRGSDLAKVVLGEAWLSTQADWFRLVQTKWVPLVTWDGIVIAKSHPSLIEDSEVAALPAIQSYGLDKLHSALRQSLADGVDEWEEIKKRWLRGRTWNLERCTDWGTGKLK